MVDGCHRRFCQHCGRFHPIAEFDGMLKSCRKALELHRKNQNRRNLLKRIAASGIQPNKQAPEENASSGNDFSTSLTIGKLKTSVQHYTSLIMAPPFGNKHTMHHTSTKDFQHDNDLRNDAASILHVPDACMMWDELSKTTDDLFLPDERNCDIVSAACINSLNESDLVCDAHDDHNNKKWTLSLLPPPPCKEDCVVNGALLSSMLSPMIPLPSVASASQQASIPSNDSKKKDSSALENVRCMFSDNHPNLSFAGQPMMTQTIVPGTSGLPSSAEQAHDEDMLIVKFSLKMFDAMPSELPESIYSCLKTIISADGVSLSCISRPGCVHVTMEMLVSKEEKMALESKGPHGVLTELIKVHIHLVEAGEEGILPPRAVHDVIIAQLDDRVAIHDGGRGNAGTSDKDDDVHEPVLFGIGGSTRSMPHSPGGNAPALQSKNSTIPVDMPHLSAVIPLATLPVSQQQSIRASHFYDIDEDNEDALPSPSSSLSAAASTCSESSAESPRRVHGSATEPSSLQLSVYSTSKDRCFALLGSHIASSHDLVVCRRDTHAVDLEVICSCPLAASESLGLLTKQGLMDSWGSHGTVGTAVSHQRLLESPSPAPPVATDFVHVRMPDLKPGLHCLEVQRGSLIGASAAFLVVNDIDVVKEVREMEMDARHVDNVSLFVQSIGAVLEHVESMQYDDRRHSINATTQHRMALLAERIAMVCVLRRWPALLRRVLAAVPKSIASIESYAPFRSLLSSTSSISLLHLVVLSKSMATIHALTHWASKTGYRFECCPTTIYGNVTPLHMCAALKDGAEMAKAITALVESQGGGASLWYTVRAGADGATPCDVAKEVCNEGVLAWLNEVGDVGEGGNDTMACNSSDCAVDRTRGKECVDQDGGSCLHVYKKKNWDEQMATWDVDESCGMDGPIHGPMHARLLRRKNLEWFENVRVPEYIEKLSDVQSYGGSVQGSSGRKNPAGMMRQLFCGLALLLSAIALRLLLA